MKNFIINKHENHCNQHLYFLLTRKKKKHFSYVSIIYQYEKHCHQHLYYLLKRKQHCPIRLYYLLIYKAVKSTSALSFNMKNIVINVSTSVLFVNMENIITTNVYIICKYVNYFTYSILPV